MLFWLLRTPTGSIFTITLSITLRLDFLLSGLAVQRLSDLICLEHSLSVIEIKPYRERQKRVLYPPKESNRDQLCGVIDSILADKPGSYEEFLKNLEQQGYEVKRGKFTSVKGVRQKIHPVSDFGGGIQ